MHTASMCSLNCSHRSKLYGTLQSFAMQNRCHRHVSTALKVCEVEREKSVALFYAI